MARARSQMAVAPEFQRVVRQLPKAMEKRVYAAAVAAGARVIKKEAVDRLRGAIDDAQRKDIVVRKRRRPRQGAIVSYEVGLSSERWWLVFKEFGRQELVAKGAAIPMTMEDGSVVFTKRARAVPPRPFFRPAWDKAGDAAMRKTGELLLKGLERETKKLAGSFSKSGLGRRRRRR